MSGMRHALRVSVLLGATGALGLTGCGAVGGPRSGELVFEMGGDEPDAGTDAGTDAQVDAGTDAGTDPPVARTAEKL